MCLSELMPVQVLKAGDGTDTHVMNIGSTLTVGAVIAKRVLDDEGLFDHCKLGMVALLFIHELVKERLPIPDFLLDPVEEALNRIVDVQRQMDRAALTYVFEEAQTRSRRILAVDLSKAGLLLPTDETIERYAGKSGIAFIEHQAMPGKLSADKPMTWEAESGAEYAVEKDAIAYFE